MPKTVPVINTGKTFTFKTHSCLEKLRLVANADSLRLFDIFEKKGVFIFL